MPHLRDYFHSGRILLLGKTLASDTFWNHLLVQYLCSPRLLLFKPNTYSQKLGAVHVSHFDNVEVVVKTKLDDIATYDAIILGVNGEAADTQLDMLVKVVQKLYREFNTRLISCPLPQILVFPTAKEHVAALSYALTEPEPPRFLNRLAQIGQGRESINEFELTLIRMLKDSVANALGLPFPRGFDALNNWLSQFRDGDHPLLLRVLRNFRYYPAETQRALLDNYLTFVNKLGDGKPSRKWLTYLGRPNKSAPAVLTLAAKTAWANGLVAKNRLAVKTYDDLVANLAKETKKLTAGETLEIYFVDDVVGSGGQLVSYLEKFLNDRLATAKGPGGLERWKLLIGAMLEEGSSVRVRLNAVFIIGVRSDEFEKLFPEGLQPVQVSEEFAGTRPMAGDLRIKVRESKGRKELGEIKVRVHVIDYTRSIFELCDNEDLPRHKLESLLNRYVGITRARQKEHWLQFEPFGWKEGGALVSTHLNCPGNTLPIIWGEGRRRTGVTWRPLFPRYFNPWDDGSKNAASIIHSLEFDADRWKVSDRKLVAYILKSLTLETPARIAHRVKLDQAKIESALVEIENKLWKDEKYREKLRGLFRIVS